MIKNLTQKNDKWFERVGKQANKFLLKVNKSMLCTEELREALLRVSCRVSKEYGLGLKNVYGF